MVTTLKRALRIREGEYVPVSLARKLEELFHLRRHDPYSDLAWCAICKTAARADRILDELFGPWYSRYDLNFDGVIYRYSIDTARIAVELRQKRGKWYLPRIRPSADSETEDDAIDWLDHIVTSDELRIVAVTRLLRRMAAPEDEVQLVADITGTQISNIV